MALSRTSGIGVRRGLAVLVMSTIAVAACSDDDEPRAADTTDAPSSTDAPTTTPPPSTESPSTTEPAAITPPPTTAAPTTDPPTTAPTSPTDAAVAAFNAMNEARHRCIADLPNCEPATAYAPYFGTEQLQSAIAEIEEAQDKGYIARNVQSLTETIEDVRSSPDDTRSVDIQFCGEDGVILVEPTASGESIINDRFSSGRLVAHMRLESDNHWRVQRYTGIGERVVGQENSICD